ncbi:hypothetical protein LRZ95_00690 [Candidatus Gracilibacteria bacterium]|nr:hypothetical protein [Candidatus Gracilibacteria bacterium]
MNPLSIEDKIKFELVELYKGDKFKLSGYQIITVVSGKILNCNFIQILFANIKKIR